MIIIVRSTGIVQEIKERILAEDVFDDGELW
jgi:hypothetical protein